MKDNLKTDWSVLPLGTACEAVSTGPFGSLLGKKDYVENGVPVVNPIDIVGGLIQPASIKRVSAETSERLASYRMRPDDIVVARRGELGRCARVTEESAGWLCGTGSFFVRPSELLSAEFLARYIGSPTAIEYFDAASTGATMPNISNKTLSSLPLPLPPLEEQQRIVAVLDEAFEGLARARTHAEANLQNARELFERELNAAFESLSEQHGVKALGGLTDFRNGFAFKSARFKPSGKPIVRISNIQDGEIDEAKMVFTDPDDYSEDLTRYEVQPDDLLIAMSGATTGKVGFNTTGNILLQNQRVGRFRSTEKLDLRFLYYFLSTKVAEHLSISAGAAQPNLSTKQINEIEIPAPPLDIQMDFLRKIELLKGSVGTLRNNYDDNLQDIDDLRQSLLQKAFAGELT